MALLRARQLCLSGTRLGRVGVSARYTQRRTAPSPKRLIPTASNIPDAGATGILASDHPANATTPLAKRMGATTIEIDAGYLSRVSHVPEVTGLIMMAVSGLSETSSRLQVNTERSELAKLMSAAI